jgi:hypothetical protein
MICRTFETTGSKPPTMDATETGDIRVYISRRNLGFSFRSTSFVRADFWTRTGLNCGLFGPKCKLQLYPIVGNILTRSLGSSGLINYLEEAKKKKSITMQV